VTLLAYRFVQWHATVRRWPEVGHHVCDHNIVAAGSVGDAVALGRIDHRRLHVRHSHDLILMGRDEETSIEWRPLRPIVHGDHARSDTRKGVRTREDHSPHRVPYSQSVQYSRRVVRLVQHSPHTHRVEFGRVEEVV
ncbi:hypothetical protein PMAYCL1PPCAC_17048, partial [Pristionchus mayeri]